MYFFLYRRRPSANRQQPHMQAIASIPPSPHTKWTKTPTKTSCKQKPEPKVEQNIEKLPITEIKYYNVIKKIYHISDIHIHLNFKHDEYREVFSKLYDVLKQEPKPKNSCVVITGDILHSKLA